MSSTGYKWNVRVVDSEGSEGSGVNSTFVTGLLKSEFSPAIWITGGNTANQLRKEFTLPDGKQRRACKSNY